MVMLSKATLSADKPLRIRDFLTVATQSCRRLENSWFGEALASAMFFAGAIGMIIILGCLE